MAFQHDIKKAIADHGLDTMRTAVLPNILADTSEDYKNNPVLKNIFKDFFHEGNDNYNKVRLGVADENQK